ncbi:AI-2E family transporter [Halorubellus sp. JP-L1]|uniref:AI-2E family transporter n=1 Tax=Halorubellus sp. JP-L1 TaxID=2715753 RepID=UPI00140BBFF9|nr:AI-2E family transporter [Halorubellus sp. JP-L1]NHN40687.1 AI-2E family transporter [Halorubellus sp. JP-L1]
MLGGIDVSRSRAQWVVAGLLLALTIAFVLYSFVGTFVFGLFMYYATRPVYRRLKRRVRPPSLAAAIAIFTLALPFVLLAAYTIAIGLQELSAFTGQLRANNTTFGQYQGVLQPYFDVSQVAENPATLVEDSAGREAIQRIVVESQQYLFFIGNALLHLFIMAALAFYLLRDGSRLSQWTKANFGDDRGVMDAYFRAVDRDFSSIFFGNILNAFITGIIGTLAYSLLNVYAPGDLFVPYAALVGLLCGAASLIPVVGMKLVYFPVTAYLFVRAAMTDATGVLWFPVLFFAVSFLVVDVIPDLVLRPYVSGRNLHVGTVMFAYILGPLLFGWYGLFLGPVILVLGVHFARLVLPELLHDERLQPYAVDPTYFAGEAGPQSTTVGNASAREATIEGESVREASAQGESAVEDAPADVADVPVDDGAGSVPGGNDDA